MKDYSKFDYEERAAIQDPMDFWSQVRRTINGKPVSEDQIQLIYSAIYKGLALNKDDTLIDAGCGNGALTYLFENDVYSIYAVDRSKYLISVAKNNFSSKKIKYINAEILDTLKSNTPLRKYQKLLLYGVFSFLDYSSSIELFELITRKTKIKRIFIGNVRDISLSSLFYGRDMDQSELNDHTSSMGIWHDRDFFIKIGDQFNWDVKFTKMPVEFYAHKYYFDVTLNKIQT